MSHNVECERCGGHASRIYHYRWPDGSGQLAHRVFIDCVRCGMYLEGSPQERTIPAPTSLPRPSRTSPDST
jgi:hypothetical protein